MFLIEWRKDQFVDAEKIDIISLGNGEAVFTLAGNSDNGFQVEDSLIQSFREKIRMLDKNNLRASNV